MASEIRVNKITHTAGVGTVTTNTHGIVVSGIVTATTFKGNVEATTGSFSGNLGVGGVLTYEDVTNIDSVGVITARDGLRVTGIATISGDVSIADKIIHTGDTNTAIRFPGADQFSIETAGSQRLLTRADGRIQITSGNFEVIGGEGANAEFRLTADEGDDGADYWRFQSAASGNNLNIATYASGAWVDKVSIDTNGKIGIGVASPSSFDVDGDDVVISTSGHTGMTINSGSAGSTSRGSIYFAEGTAGDADKTRGAIQYQHGTDFMRFITNTVERLRISSAGYVTKPAHPTFCARYSSGEANSYSSGDVIKLTLVAGNYLTWDTTSSYSVSTGKFTAPVAGVYYFEGQLMTTGHSNGDNIQDIMQLTSSNGLISHPRQRRSYFRSDADANGYFTNSAAGLTKLSSGDTVWLKAVRTFGVTNTNYCYFTGWLIG